MPLDGPPTAPPPTTPPLRATVPFSNESFPLPSSSPPSRFTTSPSPSASLRLQRSRPPLAFSHLNRSNVPESLPKSLIRHRSSSELHHSSTSSSSSRASIPTSPSQSGSTLSLGPSRQSTCSQEYIGAKLAKHTKLKKKSSVEELLGSPFVMLRSGRVDMATSTRGIETTMEVEAAGEILVEMALEGGKGEMDGRGSSSTFKAEVNKDEDSSTIGEMELIEITGTTSTATTISADCSIAEAFYTPPNSPTTTEFSTSTCSSTRNSTSNSTTNSLAISPSSIHILIPILTTNLAISLSPDTLYPFPIPPYNPSPTIFAPYRTALVTYLLPHILGHYNHLCPYKLPVSTPHAEFVEFFIRQDRQCIADNLLWDITVLREQLKRGIVVGVNSVEGKRDIFGKEWEIWFWMRWWEVYGVPLVGMSARTGGLGGRRWIRPVGETEAAKRIRERLLSERLRARKKE